APNRVQADFGTVGGGVDNTASDDQSTIGGGRGNTASNVWATIAGGFENTASGLLTTIGGGFNNTASNRGATVGGGEDNIVSGYHATIPGGSSNSATMSDTLAAGHRAQANHTGAFVWADSTEADFASTGNNQFLIRAAGGVGINTNAPSSDLTISSNSSLVTAIDLYNTTTVSGTYGYRFQVVGSSVPLREGNLEIWGAGSGVNYMTVQPGGNIGLGTTSVPDKLTVNGDIRVGTADSNGCVSNFGGTALIGQCSSDVRLKQNITAFPNVLDKVTALQPVYYNWRAAEYPAYQFDGSTRSYGVIAQDVEQVLPELVGSDAHGFKTVNYSEIPLLLLQALKDLRLEKDKQLAAQQKQIDDLQARLANLDQSAPPAPFNLFNLLSVIAFCGVAFNWLQQRRSKRGQA
ncbi:MAG TPA: tail fiber domain-containing protein, partial [Anaerolineae bacterium]|nr:tail fiber domain-containing protein [Anaerolineae bacterium]